MMTANDNDGHDGLTAGGSTAMILSVMREVQCFYGDDGTQMALAFTMADGRWVPIHIPRAAIEPMVAMLERGARVLDEWRSD